MTLPVSCLKIIVAPGPLYAAHAQYINAFCEVDSSTKSYGDFKFSSHRSPVIIRCKLTKGDNIVIDVY